MGPVAKAAIPTLKEMLKDPDRSVRVAALTDAAVRETAANAIEKINKETK